MSTWILKLFIFEFAVLGIFGFKERNLGMVLYGLGGAILNIGVLKMGG